MYCTLAIELVQGWEAYCSLTANMRELFRRSVEGVGFIFSESRISDYVIERWGVMKKRKMKRSIYANIYVQDN
jgi:hypothetical protein